jgi:hypothetical protein
MNMTTTGEGGIAHTQILLGRSQQVMSLHEYMDAQIIHETSHVATLNFGPGHQHSANVTSLAKSQLKQPNR